MIGTVHIYLNWVWAILQNPHVVAFEPAAALGLWGVLGLMLEGYKCRYQIPVWTWAVGFFAAWGWMFFFWQFYLPTDEQYLLTVGPTGYVVASLIGSGMFAFITPFIVGIFILVPFWAIPLVVIEVIKDPSLLTRRSY